MTTLHSSRSPSPPVRPKNNIGVLRLVLASIVILSHSVEFTDGSRKRELLTRLFHTVSLGDAALTGFFLLSGFLITRSFLVAPSAGDFLLRRVARIYPAFLVAYLVAIFIEAPLLGISPWPDLPRLLGNALILREPVIASYHLNTPAWTIVFEFRCYLLTLILGSLGLLRRPALILGLTVAVTVAAYFSIEHEYWWRIQQLQGLPGWIETIGEIRRAFQFGSSYLVGSCVYLFWTVIIERLTGVAALTCAAIIVALLGINLPMANLALSTVGAVPLFWLAFRARLGKVQRVNDRWDISYGVYLYGWMIQTLLVAAFPAIDPVTLTFVALLLAWLAGTVSWIWIERKSKHWLQRRPAIPA